MFFVIFYFLGFLFMFSLYLNGVLLCNFFMLILISLGLKVEYDMLFFFLFFLVDDFYVGGMVLIMFGVVGGFFLNKKWNVLVNDWM